MVNSNWLKMRPWRGSQMILKVDSGLPKVFLNQIRITLTRERKKSIVAQTVCCKNRAWWLDPSNQRRRRHWPIAAPVLLLEVGRSTRAESEALHAMERGFGQRPQNGTGISLSVRVRRRLILVSSLEWLVSTIVQQFLRHNFELLFFPIIFQKSSSF